MIHRLSNWKTVLLRLTAVLLLAATLPQVASAQPAESAAQHDATGQNGVVVSATPQASQVGLEILQQGGNAVDAAVATAFALAVTWPEAGNIGGGGFMMIHSRELAEPRCIEYRERAPAAASATMYVDDDEQYGLKVVGVPGMVRGMSLAHRRFGKLPWQTLVQPSVALAQEGFVVEERLAANLTSIVKRSPKFAEFVRVYGPPHGRDAWKAGDRLVQPDLAFVLRAIANGGPDAFYEGVVADLIVKEMQQGGGLITKQDLADYYAVDRRPIHGTYRGFDVYAPPPPSSGGTCLVEMLNILETFDLKSAGRYSPRTLHLMAESMRRAFYDRARFIGDGDYVEIPTHLTQKQYATHLAGEINLQQATRSEDLATDIPLADEGPSTTHFSVVDGNGMAVSNTYTLQNSYGSRMVVRGGGFILNNEMTDFNWRPGYTDRKGRIGTDANLIRPGKRMLSSQTPIIVTKDGQARLVTGSPGGRTIINTGLCLVLNVLEFNMSLREAVDAPRLHHQWFPDVLRFEGSNAPQHAKTVETLQQMGHTINSPDKPSRQGDAHSILIDPQTGRLIGAADKRRLGSARAF